MPRIRHIGGVGSILTVKGGVGGGSFVGAPFTPMKLMPWFSIDGTYSGSLADIHFRPDGKRFYVINYGAILYEFTMSTPWRVDTAKYVGSVTIPSASASLGFFFKPDGTALYISDPTTAASIIEYSLSTAWDISTLAFVTEKVVSSQTTSPRGMAIKPDGTKLLLVGGGAVNEYTMGTPWSLSTLTYVGSASFLGTNYSVVVNPHGTRLFHDRPTTNEISGYVLGTPWAVGGTNIADASTNNLAVSGLRHLFMRDDGRVLYNMSSTGFIQQFGGV